MTVLNAGSRSRLLTGACPTATDRPRQGRRRRFWETFLTALLRALSVATA
jgi:hypothetical protein